MKYPVWVKQVSHYANELVMTRGASPGDGYKQAAVIDADTDAEAVSKLDALLPDIEGDHNRGKLRHP